MSTPASTRRPATTPTLARTPTAAGPNAGPRSASFRTPTVPASGLGGGGGGGARRTPGTAGGGGGITAVRTPHARAARQALDRRRTALFTPGGRQSRRKSGRMLRESPRDLLRNLSRRLAPTSRAIALSSSSPATTTTGSSGGGRSRRSMATIVEGQATAALGGGNNAPSPFGGPRRGNTLYSSWRTKNDPDGNSSSDSIPLDRPRMSLPIGDDDDDDNDDDLRPHRSAMLDSDGDNDENLTLRSIEVARRTATLEQRLQARRLSRASLGSGSLGSIRMSDYIDGFLGGVAAEENVIDDAFFPEDAFDHLHGLPGGDTTFERLDSETDERRDALEAGRESGFGVVDVPLDGNETTFLLGAGPPSPDQTALGPANGDVPGADVPFEDLGGFDGFNGLDAGEYNENNNIWLDEPAATDEDEDVDVDVVKATARAANDGAAADDQLRKKTTKDGSRGDGGKRLKLSAHGIPYPSLPPAVVKRVAQTFAAAQSSSGAAGAGRAKLSPDTVAALSKASDWFFEQAAVDLQRYAVHGGRKTIDESDMLLLMRRQRQTNATTTPFSLAQRFLPRELVQELRMAPDVLVRKHRPRRPPPRMSTGGGGKGRMR